MNTARTFNLSSTNYVESILPCQIECTYGQIEYSYVPSCLIVEMLRGNTVSLISHIEVIKTHPTLWQGEVNSEFVKVYSHSKTNDFPLSE